MTDQEIDQGINEAREYLKSKFPGCIAILHVTEPKSSRINTIQNISDHDAIELMLDVVRSMNTKISKAQS